MKVRETQMDVLRGLGIILIVLGHAAFSVYTFFIFISFNNIFYIIRLLFKEEYVKDKESLKKFIILKIKKIVCSICNRKYNLCVIKNTFISLNLYDNINHEYFGFKDIIVNIIKNII